MVRESSEQFTNTAKSLIWLLRMNKLKTKYNDLAQCKPESFSLSTALLAMAETVVMHYKSAFMALFTPLKINPVSIVTDFGIAELKTLLEGKEKSFFLRWISDNQFMISLNFSIGTNHAFDINNDAKSAIIAYGTISKLSENKTDIVLETKFKYGLILILVIPLIMLILELTTDLGIPLPFYFVFPLVFILVLLFFRSEEKRLIRDFREYLNSEKNNTLQQHL